MEQQNNNMQNNFAQNNSMQNNTAHNGTVQNPDIDMTKLPLNTFKEIPQPNANAKQIVALVKKSGKIAGYQLSDGQILDKQQGIQMAKQGEIQGVGIASRKGNEYLKSLPDNDENNNLGNLPTVKQ